MSRVKGSPKTVCSASYSAATTVAARMKRRYKRGREYSRPKTGGCVDGGKRRRGAASRGSFVFVPPPMPTSLAELRRELRQRIDERRHCRDKQCCLCEELSEVMKEQNNYRELEFRCRGVPVVDEIRRRREHREAVVVARREERVAARAAGITVEYRAPRPQSMWRWPLRSLNVTDGWETDMYEQIRDVQRRNGTWERNQCIADTLAVFHLLMNRFKVDGVELEFLERIDVHGNVAAVDAPPPDVIAKAIAQGVLAPLPDVPQSE